MSLRKVIVALFFPVFILLAYCQPSASETPQVLTQSSPALQPGFIHTVFFWMKDDLTDEQKKAFEKGLEKLTSIPSIQSAYWGPPAMTAREVVDNSYDYAWIVHFANEAEHDLYQEDQVHLDFIEESKEWWERVQIYDNLVR